KRTATVARPATVGVHDDLAASQAAVAHRTADLELSGRIDVELGALVEPLGRQYRLQDVLPYRLDQVLLLDARVVLGRQHDRVDGGGDAVLVAQRDLALGIRTQPRQRRVLALAYLRLLLDQTVRKMDRRRH